MWLKLLIVAAGGTLGALARYGLSGLVSRWAGAAFPWGTFAVNMIGCFCFGVIFAMSEQRLSISPQVRLLLLTGFLGAFTTFSTYAFESAQMMRDAQWLPAAGNLIGQTVVGLVLMLGGLKLGQWV